MTTQILYCHLSGLPIATLDMTIAAGQLPFLLNWRKAICLHPIMSLEPVKTLAFARHEWNRLARASEDGETTKAEDTILQVSFLALLHHLDTIKQDCPALPSIQLVRRNMQKLFALSYWYNYLDSQRFSFPTYHISRENGNADFANIGDYLDLCFEIKADYENGYNDIIEEEKLRAAERALKALRNNWVVPTSRKALWRWVCANLPSPKYDAEKQGWMTTLFLGSERTILAFDKEEIQLLEEIIISECPQGTGVLFAVRERLDTIKQIYIDNKEAFTVDFDDYEGEELLVEARKDSKAPTSVEAPKLSDFPDKVSFIKANALFYLQSRAIATKNTQADKL